jgi:hypothetical protein
MCNEEDYGGIIFFAHLRSRQQSVKKIPVHDCPHLEDSYIKGGHVCVYVWPE